VEESNDSRAVSGGGERSGRQQGEGQGAVGGCGRERFMMSFYRHLRLPFSAILFPPALACTRTPPILPPPPQVIDFRQ